MLMALAAAGDDARGRALRRRAWAPETERPRGRRWTTGEDEEEPSLVGGVPVPGKQWWCRRCVDGRRRVRWEVGWMDKVGGRIDLVY
jgi:hypothetical protein